MTVCRIKEKNPSLSMTVLTRFALLMAGITLV